MQNPAVVFTGVGQVEIRDVPLTAPGPSQVQVRTLFSGVSAGTEGWALRDQFSWQATPFPCVPGYQRVGVVTAVGKEAGQFAVSDRVFVTTGQWSDEVRPSWGGHIACANSAAGEVLALPPQVDSVDAAHAVVAQVGYNAASRPRLEIDDWVLVYGDGLIGQCAAQAARARGARVILAGHRSNRLDLAAHYSADYVLNTHGQDIVALVRQHTGGSPVAVVLDTVQTEAAQQQYISLLEHGRGQIVYCGFAPANAWANMALLQQRELTAYFVSGWNRPRLEATLQLMASGQMRIRPLTTHTTPISRAPEMYRLIEGKTEPFLGITFDWRKPNA